MEDNLLTLFRANYPEFEGLEAVMNGTTLCIGERGQDPVFWVYEHEHDWATSTNEAHGHRETEAEALEVLAQLLKGQIRCATEHRGDMLAATWFEIWDGEAYEVADKSLFLSPYDADEWTPLAGETWKQVRVSRLYVPETRTIAVSSFEIESPLSTFGIPEMTNWFDEGLGPPVDGMRWTAGIDYQFVFQAPRRWRRKPFEEDQRWLNLAQPDGPLVLRAYNVYRDAEAPGPFKNFARSPESITYEHKPGAEWCSHAWTLIFTDGEQDMMGVLELFYPPAEESAAEPIRELLERTIPLSLYPPPDWDMTRAGND